MRSSAGRDAPQPRAAATSFRAGLLRVGLCVTLLVAGAVGLALAPGDRPGVAADFAALMLAPGIVATGGLELCGTCSPPASTATQVARVLGWSGIAIAFWTLVGTSLRVGFTRAHAARRRVRLRDA